MLGLTNFKNNKIMNTKKTLNENKKVLNFIENFRLKNEYNPISLKPYNKKFNIEFKHFLNNSNLSKETINIFN